ncbi:unnamed protein product [Caenorhabditis auriculariae]|uniref:Uncharacterized protein n=1 Tax=Caenorhabditis auriculariae TaxID=2777116 RepID=A0A8S1GXP5_9PELO|nr:unnamed protein product [Caenorhabditis auriculariae]
MNVYEQNCIGPENFDMLDAAKPNTALSSTFPTVYFSIVCYLEASTTSSNEQQKAARGAQLFRCTFRVPRLTCYTEEVHHSLGF